MAEALKQKPLVGEQAMNKLVKFVAKNQNAKNKLNAGGIREMIRLVIVGSATQLETHEILGIHELVRNSRFAQDMEKAAAIEHHEAELKKLKG